MPTIFQQGSSSLSTQRRSDIQVLTQLPLSYHFNARKNSLSYKFSAAIYQISDVGVSLNLKNNKKL